MRISRMVAPLLATALVASASVPISLVAQTTPAANASGSPAISRGATVPRGAGTRAATNITLTVAIVGDNLSVKPVPLHELRFTPTAGGEALVVRTALDGTAVATLPAGQYALESAAPVTIGGTSYLWRVTVDAVGGPLKLELTNANATTASSSTTPARTRQMAPEMEVYRAVRAGVFRIESGLSHGSGFLVDPTGLILTNAHVVAGQLTAAAVLDSATRLPLQIVHRDNDADVAVLRVAPERVRGRPVLPLGQAIPLVEAGERVFAIGYPLNQDQTLTSGIVSSIREGAIISDVNINHGNSGGPMLNLAGEVVAINTFGDFTNQGGPGISGSIVITRAAGPVAEARLKVPSLPAPDSTPLPLLPSGRFRIQDLKAFADSVKPAHYARFDSIGIGRFFVTVTTPPIAYVRQKAFEAAIAKDRKKREEKAGIDAEARYSEMRDFRDWNEYVGDERAPVVALTVEPKVGETSGSVFRRLLLTGPGGKATVRYSADLQDAFIFRNGQPVSTLRGGTTPVKAYVDNSWVDLKDVANYGYFVLPAEAFAPDSAGTPPSVVIELADFKNPASGNCKELPREVTATIWNDFALYYGATGEAHIRADPSKKPVDAPDKSDVCKQSRKARGAPPLEY
jgi:S1-C subfamily serine protease